MPWKEGNPMDERLRFVARLLEGEKMAPLRRESGISRVTGHKLFKECGLEAFKDRSRRIKIFDQATYHSKGIAFGTPSAPA